MNKMNNSHPAGKPAGRPGSPVASGSEGPKATKRRRERTKFSAEQVATLQAFFDEDPYPDHGQCQELAGKIGVGESRVSVWFQNRRARHPKGEEGDEGKKAAKRPRSAKRAAPQSRTGALPPPTAAAATQRMMAQSSWTGYFGSHQTWASQDQLLTRSYECESSQFGSGQAPPFSYSHHWSPNVQNPHLFGTGVQDWRPQQQSQPTPQDSGFHFGSYCQGQVYTTESQQEPGQATVVVQDSVLNTGKTGAIMDIIRYLEDDGCAVPATPGISPALPGEVPSVEHNPLGTCQPHLPSTAQWPCPQWGTLPGQDNLLHLPSYQGPF